jgi:iron(III) transport system permease protein
VSEAVQSMPVATSTFAAKRLVLGERHVAGALIIALCVVLVLIIALPLWALLSKSLENGEGRFVGLANFVTYATTPTLVASLVNSLTIAGITTLIVLPLAFLYAYALRRSCIPWKGAFYAAALVPVFAPSLLSGLALIYVFGNQGCSNRG